MLAADLEQGRPYARREPPQDRNAPLQKVRVVGPARSGKVKIAFAEGELAGLEEWVASRSLLCRWGDRKAFLRDEGAEDRLRRVSDDMRDRVVEEAISFVLTATGEEGGFSRTWSLPPDKARRLWARAGLADDPARAPYAYVDRVGMLHLSYETALNFAQAFAAAEPEPCLLYIEEWETKLRAEGFEPGNRHFHTLMREWGPATALVRQWTSASDIDRLQQEIKRLREIAYLAVRLLNEAGATSAARRVERALHGG